jgi:hypothetical protein
MNNFRKLRDNLYIADKNMLEKVKEFYLAVYVSDDGKEGVLSEIDFNLFPAIEKVAMGASVADRDYILKYCEKISKEKNIKINVLKFSNCEIIKKYGDQ